MLLKYLFGPVIRYKIFKIRRACATVLILMGFMIGWIYLIWKVIEMM